MGTGKKRRADLLLILALLAIAGIAWLVMHFSAETGGVAVITVDGAELIRLRLSEDIQLTVGENGWNKVVVRDGAVRVEDASCPDHLCVNQGWIRYSGETIICLPNKLVISIEGADTGDVDIVSQ